MQGELKEEVERVFEVDFTRKDKSRDIAEARHVLSYLLRKYTSLSYRRIGIVVKQSGDLYSAHCRTIHSIKTCKHLMEIDKEFRFKVQLIENNIKSWIN